MIIEKGPLLATSKFIEINGSNMHYLEAGQGDPILFLHGVPTSSYLWRNIIPHLAPLGRCIAPDLIGFGESDKPAIEYSIFDHIQYIEKFIESLHLKNITLILHGWGSLIGFHYATHHENNCHALVFYEAFLREEKGEYVSLPYHEQLMLLQQQENMQVSVFIDQMLSQQAMKKLNEEDMKYYRQPFLKEGSGKPILQYLKEALSLNAEKNPVGSLIANYSQKLIHCQLPKLMLYSLPGFITPISTAMWAKENLPALEIADVGEELHLAQENCPELIGETISAWLQGVEQNEQKT